MVKCHGMLTHLREDGTDVEVDLAGVADDKAFVDGCLLLFILLLPRLLNLRTEH